MTVPDPETQLEFWRRKAAERAKDVAKLQSQLAHVYALLTESLSVHVRHGLASDLQEALEMVQESMQEAVAQ